MLSLRRLTEPRPLRDKRKCHVAVRRRWRARGVGEEVVVRVNTALFIVRAHTAATGFLQSDVHMMNGKNLVFLGFFFSLQHVHLPWDTLGSAFPGVKNSSDCCSSVQTLRQFIRFIRGGGLQSVDGKRQKKRERREGGREGRGGGSHCLFFFFFFFYLSITPGF